MSVVFATRAARGSTEKTRLQPPYTSCAGDEGSLVQRGQSMLQNEEQGHAVAVLNDVQPHNQTAKVASPDHEWA